MAKKKAANSKTAGTVGVKKATSAASKPQVGKAEANGAVASKTSKAVKSSPPMVTDSIGEIAGVVWRCLNENGPQPIAKLKRLPDVPADLALAAIGWLAREGKLSFESDGKQATIALR